MPRPLPRPLQEAKLSGADNFRYAFYTASPLTVRADGSVAEAKADEKDTFLSDAVKAWNQARSRVEPLVEAAAGRMETQARSLVAQGFEVRCVTHSTATRLLAGLGYKNGVEVGLSLHPLYGVPYLPGSSVKGVVRAWAERQKTSSETMTRLFGSATRNDGDEANHRLGGLRFFDALPAAWPRLERDVMTPHFGPYYQDPKVDPANWHDPVPVGFLAVAAGSPFRFLVAADPAALPGDLELGLTWLEEALAWLGAGGKTAAGYGRFATSGWDALFH